MKPLSPAEICDLVGKTLKDPEQSRAASRAAFDEAFRRDPRLAAWADWVVRCSEDPNNGDIEPPDGVI